jgi:hypothetical protein
VRDDANERGDANYHFDGEGMIGRGKEIEDVIAGRKARLHQILDQRQLVDQLFVFGDQQLIRHNEDLAFRIEESSARRRTGGKISKTVLDLAKKQFENDSLATSG